MIALLLLMAVPFAGAQFGVPDERVLPKDAESRVVTEAVRTHFDAGDDRALNVVSENWKATNDQLVRYAADLSKVTGVTRVVSSAGVFQDGTRAAALEPPAAAGYRTGSAVRLQVQTGVVPYSEKGGDLAREIRAVAPPGGNAVLVGGQAAQLVDITHSIASKLPLAIVLISVLSLLFLFLLTGSVVMPVKALLFNALSLVGILGVAVWIFQDGHLSGPLGFTPSPLAVSMPVLVFCIAFGLSMDYEVFLVARIKERHDRTGHLESSVREGLGASGPVITAAAAVLAVSFFAMLSSGVSLIKMYGLATGLAIVVDAVLVRGVLVPAFMRAVGPYNWWAPAPSRPSIAASASASPRNRSKRPSRPGRRRVRVRPARERTPDDGTTDVTDTESAPLRSIDRLREIAGTAARAANAHNTQPWELRFRSDHVEVGWRARYALGPSDPAHRDLRLSLGTYVETLLICAAEAGIPVRYEPDFDADAARVGRIRPDAWPAASPARSPMSRAGGCGGVPGAASGYLRESSTGPGEPPRRPVFG